MSETCTESCSSCGDECDERKEKQVDFTIKPHFQSNIGKVYGIVSGKGGVGKSLVTSMIASEMRNKGYGVGVLDADITGPSIPKAFGIKGMVEQNEFGMFPLRSKGGIDIMSINLLLENDTDPVVWRGPLVANAVKQFWTDVIWTNIDYMFIDMPPGTGDVPLTVFQSIKLDGIIVVTSPQELVSMIVEKAVNMAIKMDVPIIGLVENMSYFKCDACDKVHHIFGESHIEDIAKKYNLEILAKLPIDSKIAKACDEGHIEELDNNWFEQLTTKLETMAKED